MTLSAYATLHTHTHTHTYIYIHALVIGTSVRNSRPKLLTARTCCNLENWLPPPASSPPITYTASSGDVHQWSNYRSVATSGSNKNKHRRNARKKPSEREKERERESLDTGEAIQQRGSVQQRLEEEKGRSRISLERSQRKIPPFPFSLQLLLLRFLRRLRSSQPSHAVHPLSLSLFLFPALTGSKPDSQ